MALLSLGPVANLAPSVSATKNSRQVGGCLSDAGSELEELGDYENSWRMMLPSRTKVIGRPVLE